MTNNRDFAMARMAAVMATLSTMRDDAQAVVELFVDPETDKEGAERLELLEQLELGCHGVAGAIAAARDAVEGMDDAERAQAEDFDVEDDGEEDDAGDEPRTEPAA